MSIPSKSEFERRHKKYLLNTKLSLTIMFIVVGLATAWWQYAESSDQSIVVLVIIGLVALACFWFFFSRVPKQLGLGCPHCNKSVVRYRGAQRYLDVGQCPRCKKRIWQEQ